MLGLDNMLNIYKNQFNADKNNHYTCTTHDLSEKIISEIKDAITEIIQKVHKK